MKAIVLAAGKGVRMNSVLPKVLHPLNGIPLAQHVLNNLKEANVDRSIVVVGYKHKDVEETLGVDNDYVFQEEQLGTGHAVLQAFSLLKDYDGPVVVACGDAPFVSSSSFISLVSELKNGSKAAVLTMKKVDPKGYGRIIRNSNGHVIAIVEEKDASDEQRRIQEVNTGTYAFDSRLMFEALQNVGNDNAQKEYYLPDVISYLVNKQLKVTSVMTQDEKEGLGINSQEELKKAERLFVNNGI